MKTIDAVCTDMYDGYINAVKTIFKNKVLIVIDRFHSTTRKVRNNLEVQVLSQKLAHNIGYRVLSS